MRRRLRRRESDRDLEEAQALRSQAEERLAESEAQRLREEDTIVKPLRRKYHDMIIHNHVTADIIKLLREGGS